MRKTWNDLLNFQTVFLL